MLTTQSTPKTITRTIARTIIGEAVQAGLIDLETAAYRQRNLGRLSRSIALWIWIADLVVDGKELLEAAR